MEEPNTDEVRVSDHALVRYMERKLGIDLEALRQEILTPELKEMIETLHSFTYDGFVIRDKTIVTYINK